DRTAGSGTTAGGHRCNDGWRNMSGAGHGAQSGDRVVDGVEAGGAEFVAVPCLLVLKTDDHIIQMREQLIWHQIDVREGADGRPQAAHGRGSLETATDHVTHDKGDPPSRELYDVI